MSHAQNDRVRARPRPGGRKGSKNTDANGDGLNGFFRTGPVIIKPLISSESSSSVNAANATWLQVLVLNTTNTCFSCGDVFVLEDESQVFGIENKGFALCKTCASIAPQAAADAD